MSNQAHTEEDPIIRVHSYMDLPQSHVRGLLLEAHNRKCSPKEVMEEKMIESTHSIPWKKEDREQLLDSGLGMGIMSAVEKVYNIRDVCFRKN